MKHKVLIADDSLTIQKVIRITLSSEPYNLMDCDDTNQLYKMIEAEKPALVYLDFTLDEGISGYDICKKIIDLSSDTKVMMMYGTFDSIDDDLYERSGASAKITKPFDGQKFITLSHQLLDGQSFFGVEGDDQSLEAVEKHLGKVNQELSGSPVASVEGDDDHIEITEDDIDDELDWEVDDASHAVDDKTSVVNMSEFALDEDPSGEFDYQSIISDELKEWGMSVPGEMKDYEPEAISGLSHEISDKVKEMASKVDLSSAVEAADHIHMDDDIVEFEDETPITVEDTIDQVHEVQAVVDEIEPVAEEEVEDEIDFADFLPNEDGELEAKELIGFDKDNNEDKFSMLESKLTGELEEDDLWEIDEDESDEIVDQVEAAAKEEIIAHIDQDDFDSSVEKSVQAYMQEHGRAIIEKIAWEMIPDLAENIIREEVKGIADKVLSEK